MAGIAGIFKSGETGLVEKMLDSISHRGHFGKKIFELGDATVGMIWSLQEDERVREQAESRIFRDGPGYGHTTQAAWHKDNWELYRDELGVAPLYIAKDDEGILLFASEIKSLLPYSDDITEMPPGHTFSAGSLKKFFELNHRSQLISDPKKIAVELHAVLDSAVKRRIKSDTIGSWLSGGLDSSTIAA